MQLGLKYGNGYRICTLTSFLEKDNFTTTYFDFFNIYNTFGFFMKTFS